MAHSNDNANHPIRVLDGATIDRIAAGEVIERPASIVKELVENALDAGALNITITLIDGGLASLNVDDDGAGIALRDLPLAFERHATSKIASAADIMQVGTFGFRGEALASIASVSQVLCLSRRQEEEIGGLIEIAGGETVRKEPAPRHQGTSITVSDLFYNTPARRKFMRSAQAERRAVMKLLTQIALAHREVRWLVKSDKNIALDLRPAASLTDRVRDLLGGSVSGHLARFELEKGGFRVSGLASRPTWTRGNREQQYLYVNHRPIANTALSQAIFQAYREVIPAGKHPVVIAFLQIPAGEVDVNVHPAKTEVRLLLEREVFSLLKTALIDGLSLRNADDLRPWTAGATPEETELSAPQAGIARAEEDFFRRHFQRGASAGYEHRGVPEGQGELFNAGATRPTTTTGWAPAGDEPPLTGPLHTAPFWQLHRTYIVTQIRGGLVLIDQHNSHERILYNEALKALDAGSGVPTQQLLFPAHLELTPGQTQAWQSRAGQLGAMGFAIEPFGGQSILVQGIPASLKNWQEGRLLLDILDDLVWEDKPTVASQVDLLASYACHGAIRAGEPLTVPEMQNLVDQLFATDTPLSCPHGRPTLIQYSLAELEKRFGRS